MFCKNCGNEIKDGAANFCPVCGANIASHEGEANKSKSSDGINLRNLMLVISVICAIAAIFVFLYGHDVFYEYEGMGFSSAPPSSRFWAGGSGIALFVALLVVTVITMIAGIFAKK